MSEAQKNTPAAECRGTDELYSNTILHYTDIVNTLLYNELQGVTHGIITLEIHVRDGQISRLVHGRSQSVLPGGM